MNFLTPFIAIILIVGAIYFVLKNKTFSSPTEKASPFSLEVRTDMPIDECFDSLRSHENSEIFAYNYRRETDGSFMINFTEHLPTHQPIDTVYHLRFDAGKQTVLTFGFIREAFGYKEPVFPIALLEEFCKQKFGATRTD